MTEEIAELDEAALGQARRLLAEAKLTTAGVNRGLSHRANRAVAELEQLIGLSGKVVEQIRHNPVLRVTRSARRLNAPSNWPVDTTRVQLDNNERSGSGLPAWLRDAVLPLLGETPRLHRLPA